MHLTWKETKNILCAVASQTSFDADVLVCGGGPAGVAAAVMAARQGLKTVLIEKNGYAGGAAVAGLSGTICGLYLTQENIGQKKPVQVVFGFAEEFRKSLEERGGLTEPQIYGNTHVNTFDPLVWREVADSLLNNAGVHTFFHTYVTGVSVENGYMHAVEVVSSAGSAIIRCKRFIDASGDAALSTLAGLRYTRGHYGAVQNPTMMFRLSHVDEKSFYAYFGQDTICPADLTQKLTKAFEEGRYKTPRNRVWIFPTPQPSIFLMNCTQLAGQRGEILNVLNPEEHSYAEITGRAAAREYHRFFKDHVPGFKASLLIDMAPEVGVRQTRTIEGEATLTNEHVASCHKSPAGIARSSWPIELHAGEVSKLHWLSNDYYEVPYLTLVPKNINNVIVAGRCLCAEHEALASARVTAQCFEYGHAAAVATTLSLVDDMPYKNVNAEQIRIKMRAYGSAL